MAAQRSGSGDMDEESRLRFGDQLRQLREGGGLTQEELAERSGVSKETISLIERGQVRRPRKDTVTRLADALGITGEARAEFSRQPRQAMVPPSSRYPQQRASPRASGDAGRVAPGSTSHSGSAVPTAVRYQAVTIIALLGLMLVLVAVLRQTWRQDREPLHAASAPTPTTPPTADLPIISMTSSEPTLTAAPTAARVPRFTATRVTEVYVGKVRIPSMSNAGAQVRVRRSGRYTFRYVSGAYSTYQRSPASTATWSTTVFAFLSGDPKWEGKRQLLRTESALLQVGSGARWGSPEEAERAGRGASARADLNAGDLLTFVVVDQQSRYFDNRGEVVLEILFQAE